MSGYLGMPSRGEVMSVRQVQYDAASRDNEQVHRTPDFCSGCVHCGCDPTDPDDYCWVCENCDDSIDRHALPYQETGEAHYDRDGCHA